MAEKSAKSDTSSNLTKKEMEQQLSRAKAREAAAKARLKALERGKVVAEKTKLDGFMDFIRTQGVVGLAIGIVIGTQVKAVTDQLIASFINPILGLVLPGAGDLASKTFTLSVGSKQAVFAYGSFIAVVLSFVVVAAVIYYVFKGLGLDKLDKKKDA